MDESGKEKQMLANNSGGIMVRLILIDALKVGALYQNMFGGTLCMFQDIRGDIDTDQVTMFCLS